MEQITWNEVRALAAHRAEPAVSIHFSTRRNMGEAYEGSVRLKNALSEVERNLREGGQDPRGLGDFWRQAWQLIENTAFWRRQSEGLAIFLSPQDLRYFQVPIPLESFVAVGSRFHITPLVPGLEGEGFFIIAVSKKQVRMFHATQFGIGEVGLPGAPENLESLFFDQDKGQLQLHTVGHGEGAGPIHAVKFHGQAAADEPWHERTLHYLRAIDSAVARVVNGASAPVVFAGDVRLWPMYREVNTCETLAPDFVRGNPEPMQPQELHDRAWPLLRDHFERHRKHVIQTMELALAKGKATTELTEIVRGSASSRVEFMLLPAGVHEWGRFDPASGQVECLGSTRQVAAAPGAEPHAAKVGRREKTSDAAGWSTKSGQGAVQKTLADDRPGINRPPAARARRAAAPPVPGCEDLLNLAACQTIATGGRVYIVGQEEMPRGASAAAMTRF